MSDNTGVRDVGTLPFPRYESATQRRNGLQSITSRTQQIDRRTRQPGSRPAPPPIRQVQPQGPVLRLREPWQSWFELTVRVTQLPPTATTWDLFRRFEAEGKIVFIELHENSRGARQDSARIRFSPPPNNNFWATNEKIIIYPTEGDGYVVKVAPEAKKRTFQLQSPIHKMTFYPEQITLFPQALGFGIMYSETTMMTKQTEVARPGNQMKVQVDLLRKRIIAAFDIDYNTPGDPYNPRMLVKYMFQVPFGQLKVIHRVDVDNQHWALLLSLDSPPQFYLKDPDIQKTHNKQAMTWSEFDSWFRLTDIIADQAVLKTVAVGLNKTTPTMDIGRWTTYLFLFEKGDVPLHDFELVKSALQDFNIDIVDLESFSTIPSASATIWDMIDAPKSNGAKDELQYLMEDSDGSTILPFEVRYQLEVCISRNVLEQHNITPEFVRVLADLAGKDKERATSLLEYIVEQEKRIYDPMSIFNDPEALAHSPKSRIPAYCAYTRKATVTPTTIYFSSPTVETSNRVIRKYSAYGDRFLRVQFTDELFEGRINACADKIRNDQLFTRVYRTLKNGIRIGDRHFEFLAFGNSQFRENGAYFFSPTDDLSCEQIRKWMGKFHHINVVAKYAARLGLCFSTTRAIRNTGMSIVEIQDVERGDYNFTDGVGKISSFLMKMIATELHLLSEPSVIQFRMGGCKGILAVSPDARGQEVHIRKSQTKFTAEYMGLEIIRTSCYSVATLNRQTITILSSLGVQACVFNRMLDEQLSNYEEAMDNPDKALELLGRYIDDNHMTMIIASMVLDGFMNTKEPFVLSLLHLWRSWSIKLLKEKAKIIVEKGAFVLGCTDETGTLRGHNKNVKPGKGKITSEDIDNLPQIFLQVTDKNDPRHYFVVEGLCVIGRNPSLHPGDIRVVQAIDVPALHHLHDVVVFSQLGDRDVPSMCSGGDLDGDDFFVIWDPELLPLEWNVEPMDYTAATPTEMDRPVEINDVQSFFVKYMKNDALPTIAHAHLSMSDQLDMSVRDPRCLELAVLHSKAVDFVKSGVPAEMPKYLRPRRWPHFMDKKYRSKEQTYISEKVLGQLYDKVQSVGFAPDYESPFDQRILKAYDEDKAFLKAARQIKTKYDTAMRRIMAQHEIETEFEVWATFVLSKPRVGTDYKMQEEMGIISVALKDRFKDICIEAAGGKEFKVLGPFVAAMYQVTWEELAIALHECRTMKTIGGKDVPRHKMEPKSMPLMSFPWLFQSVLGRIATGTEPTDFQELGLPFLCKSEAHSKKPRVSISDENDPEDYIETADGVTHRGELLDLFRPDTAGSDGDDIDGDSIDGVDIDGNDVDIDGNDIAKPQHHPGLKAKRFDDVILGEDGDIEVSSLDLGDAFDTKSELCTMAPRDESSKAAVFFSMPHLIDTSESKFITSSLDDLAGMEDNFVTPSFADLAELDAITESAVNEQLPESPLGDSGFLNVDTSSIPAPEPKASQNTLPELLASSSNDLAGTKEKLVTPSFADLAELHAITEFAVNDRLPESPLEDSGLLNPATSNIPAPEPKASQDTLPCASRNSSELLNSFSNAGNEKGDVVSDANITEGSCRNSCFGDLADLSLDDEDIALTADDTTIGRLTQLEISIPLLDR